LPDPDDTLFYVNFMYAILKIVVRSISHLKVGFSVTSSCRGANCSAVSGLLMELLIRQHLPGSTAVELSGRLTELLWRSPTTHPSMASGEQCSSSVFVRGNAP
jgi:hypothetical protein